MISNSGGVSNLSVSFEVLSLSVMQSSFGFTNVKSITVPATGFVDNLRFLRAIETIFVRKERLNAASALAVLNLSFTLFACISLGHIFLAGFFRVSLERLRERGATRSLCLTWHFLIGL